MNIFSDMKIGTRLGLAFGAVLLITALISGMGIWRLNTLKVASEATRLPKAGPPISI